MRKSLLPGIAVVLARALASAGASAKELGLELGAGLSYGTLSISDHDSYDRYFTDLPVISVHGSYQALPKLRLRAEYTFGKATLDETDDFDVDVYSYSLIDLAGAIALTDHIDLTAGWSRFASGYVYSDEYPVRNVGGGFKLGLASDVPIAKNLSASVKYAFVPVMFASTFVDDQDTASENYMGQGHELRADLTYTTKFGVSVSLGFRSEKYTGISDCCQDSLHDVASFRGGSLTLCYGF